MRHSGKQQNGGFQELGRVSGDRRRKATGGALGRKAGEKSVNSKMVRNIKLMLCISYYNT